jgi:hypothetical protein
VEIPQHKFKLINITLNNNMLMLNWPLIIVSTGIMYIMIIIMLPFSTVYATIFLFALIAFWSRLPGVGMPHPFYILYMADLVDILSLIIAVNVSGLYGGLIAFSCNMLSRLCGVFPDWLGVTEDSIGQFIVCLIIPFFHTALGGNLIVSMIIYTILRFMLIIPVDFFLYPGSKAQWFIELIGAMFAIFIIDIAYAKFFGRFFESLIKPNVGFNWILFLIVTASMLGFYIYVFGRPDINVNKKVFRGIRKQLSNKKSKQEINRNLIYDNKELQEMKDIERKIYGR